MAGEGRLLTRYATTGWTDWQHGELWLFEDGLLYRSLGWTATLTNALEKSNPLLARVTDLLGSGSDEIESPRAFTDDELEAIPDEDPTNFWLRRTAIRSAEFSTGVMTIGVEIERADGDTLKLLWPGDTVVDDEPLAAVLEAWLGDERVRRSD